MTLSAAPGHDLFDRFDLSMAENASVLLETNAVGSWFELEAIKPYFKPDGDSM
jgi:hypothetical protein